MFFISPLQINKLSLHCFVFSEIKEEGAMDVDM